MIITRSPLRISLGGGGTDLPSYYREHEGFVIAAAIDKYVYITLHDPFEQKVIVKYSQLENVAAVSDVKHPIVREALKLMGLVVPQIEITSLSDIPAGTGLGSSGSFCVALLQALHARAKNQITRYDLAEQACQIEIGILKEPVGKQDQFIASFGGITRFHFKRDGSVEAHPVRMSQETLSNLEDNLLLFFTGYIRSASGILRDQDSRSKAGDKEMIENLHYVKELGVQSLQALECGDLHRFADIMRIHWEHKKQRSKGMSSGDIDEYYQSAMDNGALGGKLIGAGGGGFLMFYTEEKTRLRRALTAQGLREVRMRFDFDGTTVLSQH